MEVYWCENCKTPIINSGSIHSEKFKKNSYFDIEDKVLEWIYSKEKSINFYNKFLSLKKQVDKAFENDNVNRFEKNLEEQKSKLNEYVLKYLQFKKKDFNYESENSKKIVCPKCESEVKYMAKDIRPVFMEERIMLSVLLEQDFKNKNIWSGTGSRYLVDGKSIEINNKDLYNLDNLNEKIGIIRKKIEENNEVIDFTFFLEINKEHYNYIDNSAIDFIKKVADLFKKRLQVVSFSGGKDSSVVSDLVRRALNKQDILHVFGDTTLEFPFTYNYIQRFKSKPKRPPFLPVNKPEKSFFELTKLLGPPSRVMNWCCTIFKTGPIGNLFRNMTEQQNILTYYGIRRSESKSRSQYNKITKSPKISKQLVVSPIIDWYDVDVWLYLLTRSIDFNDAYKYGFTRVGCWCCPNNSKWSEFLCKIYMKEKTEKWRDHLIDFAKRIGKPDPEVYIDTGKWKARQGGRGLSSSEVTVSLEDEPCTLEDKAKNYNLSRPIEDSLYEFFKPFGIINKNIGNKMLGEVYILDPKTNQPKFILQGNEGSKQLKVKVIQDKYIKLLFQRIECQLRKFQSCIGCTACANICPEDAISLNNGYKINENKCKHCMKCVAYYHKGCIVTRTMMDY